jgi:hypothetical protein
MRPLGLLRLIILVALMVAPIGMLGRHAAMAAPQNGSIEATAGHCADMAGDHQGQSGDKAPGKNIDCMMACACTPPMGSPFVAASLVAGLSQPLPPAALVSGHDPQADPPPPRLS